MGATDRFLKRGRIQDFSRSPIAKMLSELRKFGANGHLYLPGIGTISGIDAGNYIASNDIMSAVDGLVGIAADSAGSFGANMLAYPDSGSTWVASGTTPPTAVNGADNFLGATCRSVTFPVIASAGYLVCRADSGDLFLHAAGDVLASGFDYALSRTLTAGESVTIVYTGANGVGSLNLAAGAVGNTWVTSPIKYTLCVAPGYSSLRPYATNLNAPLTVYIKNCSVKKRTGIAASQSTTGYKPTVRRGIVNLLTYSNDLSNVVWSKTFVSVAANKIVGDTSTGYHAASRGYTVPVGINHTLAFLLSSAEYSKARLSDNSSGEWYCSVDLSTGAVSASGGARFVSADSVKLSDGSVLVTVVVTGNGAVKGYGVVGYPNSGATLGIYGAQYTGDGVSGIYLYSMGIIQGSVTAAQIIAAGGIPITTTVPASSGAGACSWQFDGVDDHFILGGVPFSMADDHAVIGIGSNLAASGSRYLFDTGSSGSAVPLCGSIMFSGTAVGAQWRDDAGAANLLSGGNFPLGTNVVITGKKVGSAFTLRANGNQLVTGNTPLGATTLTGSRIGARTFSSNPYQGGMSGLVVIKGTVTDAQLLTIERGLNALSQYAAGRF